MRRPRDEGRDGSLLDNQIGSNLTEAERAKSHSGALRVRLGSKRLLPTSRQMDKMNAVAVLTGMLSMLQDAYAYGLLLVDALRQLTLVAGDGTPVQTPSRPRPDPGQKGRWRLPRHR